MNLMLVELWSDSNVSGRLRCISPVSEWSNPVTDRWRACSDELPVATALHQQVWTRGSTRSKDWVTSVHRHSTLHIDKSTSLSYIDTDGALQRTPPPTGGIQSSHRDRFCSRRVMLSLCHESHTEHGGRACELRWLCVGDMQLSIRLYNQQSNTQPHAWTPPNSKFKFCYILLKSSSPLRATYISIQKKPVCNYVCPAISFLWAAFNRNKDIYRKTIDWGGEIMTGAELTPIPYWLIDLFPVEAAAQVRGQQFERPLSNPSAV